MSVKNLAAVLAQADPVDIDEGRIAYYRYNEVIRGIADHYGYSLETTAAAFVSLSPSNSYHGNLRSLVSLLEGHKAGLDPEAITVSTYNHCKYRAYLFLQGEGADFLEATEGPKIVNFYLNITNPLDPYPVTIDGHAFNIYAGKRLPLKQVVGLGLKYDEVADAYREVAQRHRLQAHQLQAILWYTWKRIHNILYSPQLSLLGEPGDVWQSLKRPQEIRPYPVKTPFALTSLPHAEKGGSIAVEDAGRLPRASAVQLNLLDAKDES